MAVTVTVADLAVALRVVGEAAESVPAGVAETLTRQLAAATEIVQHFAPDAPEAVQNEAAVRLIGWLFDAAPADRAGRDGLVLSGAAALLVPYRAQRLTAPTAAAR